VVAGTKKAIMTNATSCFMPSTPMLQKGVTGSIPEPAIQR
jgi:hypothetical protein